MSPHCGIDSSINKLQTIIEIGEAPNQGKAAGQLSSPTRTPECPECPEWGRVGDRQLFVKAVGRLRGRLATDNLPKGVELETIAAMKVLNDKGNIGTHMTEVDGVIVDSMRMKRGTFLASSRCFLPIGM